MLQSGERFSATDGRRVIIPDEPRLDPLARMMERHGVMPHRCSFAAARPASLDGAIERWIRGVAAQQMHDLLFLSPEGVGAVMHLAAEVGQDWDMVRGMTRMRLIARGKDTAIALRRLGVRPEIVSTKASTKSLLETLKTHDLRGRVVGVQLEDSRGDAEVLDFLRWMRAGDHAVTPCVASDDQAGRETTDAIRDLVHGKFDAVAFNTAEQARRLCGAARRMRLLRPLQIALHRLPIAALSPRTADELERVGIRASVAPHSAFDFQELLHLLFDRLVGRPQAA